MRCEAPVGAGAGCQLGRGAACRARRVAILSQRDIPQQIVEQGGDYAQALKANRPTLHVDVMLFLNDPECTVASTGTMVDSDQGRIESRPATIQTDISWLQKDHQWPGLAAIARVVLTRGAPGKAATATAYYLLSTALSGARLNQVARSHWGESRPSLRLDVVMNRDQDRTRLDNGPDHLAVRRPMTLSAMQQDTSKCSLRVKSCEQNILF